jgi:CxxC motif-containing protein (DUF1111 family)
MYEAAKQAMNLFRAGVKRMRLDKKTGPGAPPGVPARWGALASVCVGLAAGCGTGVDGTGAAGDTGTGVETVTAAAVGDPLPGLQADPDLLAEARDAFNASETIADGLGPTFNERGCANCHGASASGGGGENTERRFGRFVNGIFDPMAAQGGTLRQLFSVANFNNPDLPPSSRGLCQPGNPTLCCVPTEVEPAAATVRNVGRVTTPLFGLGLVDAMPDSFFDSLAAAQPAAIRGFVNRVPILLPNPGDPTQTLGGTRVGRFGWKAGVPTLMQFSADAYNNEMGITTQSCVRGTSVTTFALENPPNALPGTQPDGCDDLAPRNPDSFGPSVGLSVAAGHQVDDPVGPCGGGRTEIQDDVFLFTVAMTALAPAPRETAGDQPSIARGQPIFTSAGCAGCHVPTTFRTPANPAPVVIGTGESVRVPGNFAFNPYSDFLLHDMGSLGDMIGNAPPDDPAQGVGDTQAVTRRMRTAPLWGIRFRNKLLHDGRTTDIPTAIRAHDGQAAGARNAFNALSPAAQADLVNFIRSL